jgi:LAO/AO transport system kinase
MHKGGPQNAIGLHQWPNRPTSVAMSTVALPPRSPPDTSPDQMSPAIAELVAGLRANDRRCLARVVTELERTTSKMPGLSMALRPFLGHSIVLGFTGPPGAGKSTLVNALIGQLRARNQSIGVIAVDPSSPISGGAILGDRLRMTAAMDDDGVFVRSLASRGALGGLSPAAVRIIDAFDAAAKDLILIETVGTGQSEIDVAEVADIRIVLAAPGLGDDIQAMKSGLLEIADILVVNKGDRPGAEETRHQLQGALHLREGDVTIPVLTTTATTGGGLDELIGAIDRLIAGVRQKSPVDRRRRRVRHLMARAASELVARHLKSADAQSIDRLADQVLNGTMTADEAARSALQSLHI